MFGRVRCDEGILSEGMACVESSFFFFEIECQNPFLAFIETQIPHGSLLSTFNHGADCMHLFNK